MPETISSSSGYLPKNSLRTYAPSRALNAWYSPSTHSSMRLRSNPSLSRASSASQLLPQMTLMTFHPAPRKSASSSWMILPLPRTGPSSRCRLQFTTKIRLSSFSRVASEIAPSDSGSSLFPSPLKAPTLRAPLQVRHEAGLVNRHDRPQAHRHGRELPELRHQPRMRIRRKSLAIHFAPK